jgi:glycosyltransferase involved in cell wall biosynthesis
MAKIKILHLITDLATGGAEIMLQKVLSQVDRSQFLNTVVSMTDAGSLGKQIEALQIPVFTLGLRRGIPNPLAVIRLVRLLRAERPHILQTWLYHSDLLGLVAGKLSRVPVIAWNVRCSDMNLQHYPRLTGVVLRALVRLSRLPEIVIFNSNAGWRFHQSLGYDPRRWMVIPNGFDLDEFYPDSEARFSFRREIRLPPEAVVVGLIARYDPMKDHQNFLRAVASVLEQRREIRFVLIGHGVDESNRELVAEIRSYNLSPYLHLLGARADVRKIMPALDVVVLSSAYGEGFPNVLGEAMASGIPCIVTNVGDAAAVVGDTGRVVNARDAAELAVAIAEIVDMPHEERRSLGRAARKRIERYFSLPSVVAQYELLYKQLVADLADHPSSNSLHWRRRFRRDHTIARGSETLHQDGRDKTDF